MYRKFKNRGNMIFVLTVSSLIVIIAFAIGTLCCIILNSANDEILNNRLNFIASSAKAQIMYRLQATQLKNNPQELRNLLEKDWENIVLGRTEDFIFDPSCDSSFNIDEICKAKIDFKNGKYSSKCNFYGSYSVEDVPAYSMDLKISAVANSKRKVFRAMISRKWPFCLSSGTYKTNIKSGSIIEGDVYSGNTDDNISISVKNTDVIPSEIKGDLIVKKTSNKRQEKKCNYSNGMFFQKEENNDFGISFDSESEEHHNGNVIYTENTFYTDGLDNALASLIHDSTPKVIDDILLEKQILTDLQSQLDNSDKNMNINEYISSIYNLYDKPYMKNTILSLSEQVDELLKTSKKTYILQKNLKLSGVDCDVEMQNPTLCSDSAYKINGTVIAFPGCFRYVPSQHSTGIQKEDVGSFGIETRNCTLFINGDLILIGDSENLRYSRDSINSEIGNSNGLFNPIRIDNSKKRGYIPYLKGTKTSIIVNGNIFLSGGYLESAEERLAIYSNENMYLKPILITDDSPQSVFKGALACRKTLKVITSSTLSSDDHDSCRMKIFGSVVCGIDEDKNEGNYGKNKLFSTNNNKIIDISYLDITYNSENIDFLNRTIGVPMLTFWSDL